MGLFGGPRRSGPAEPEDRALTMPPMWHMTQGDYANLDPAQSATSMQSVAIRSTVDLIASLASELPVVTYNAQGKVIKTPANVMDPAGDGTGVEDWTYRLLTSWLLAGNAYGAALGYGGSGRYVSQIDLFNPDDVTVSMVDGAPVWRVGGREFEDQARFIHRRTNPVAGRVLGLSPIELHASQIGVTLSATRFGRQFFTDGAHPSGLLVNEGNLTQDSAEIAKQRFLNARGSREPVVLGKGWSFSQVSISPEESQFLETSGMSEAQCARMFGPGFAEVLGYPTGSSMTYANVVDRRQDLLVFSLNRWLRRVDRVLSALIPAPQYVKLNRDALLEATTLQRYQAHALAGPWRTPDETRAIEDLPPIEGGDKLPGVSPTPAPAQEAPHGTV